MALRVRTLTIEEQETIDRLAHSRTASAREVERARIVWFANQGLKAPKIADMLHLSLRTVRTWLKRSNDGGLPALQDLPRCGAPPTYTTDMVSEVIALSLTDPQTLGLPFACWTLDRLQAYLDKEKRIHVKRSRISDLLRREGLRWRKQESWFGISERVDPDFAQKRGPLRHFTRPHLRLVKG
jgi:transposase